MSGAEFNPENHGFDEFDQARIRHAEEMEKNRAMARAERPELLTDIERVDRLGQLHIDANRQRQGVPKGLLNRLRFIIRGGL